LGKSRVDLAERITAMITIVRGATSLVELFVAEPTDESSGGPARALAHAYQQAIGAYWRGESELELLDRLLSETQILRAPSMPPWAPDAFSPHGAGGRGISWYAIDGEVLGYVPGLSGSYRVPLSAIPPLPPEA
jgi:hypothetical protein